ncbi:unnamed protein product, partial [Porites lobata]
SVGRDSSSLTTIPLRKKVLSLLFIELIKPEKEAFN